MTREAIRDAGSGDTINFSLPANSVINLTTDELVIDKSLTIAGPGANLLTVRHADFSQVSKNFRIFDISDLANPKQVAAVQSCRGSHTHSLLVDPKDKDNVYVYISGTSNVRPAEELAGCSGGEPKANPETALFRIDIIKVPLAHPELAKIVSSQG